MTLAQMHGVTFKKRAPRAIKEIKEFAYKAMVRFCSDEHQPDLEELELWGRHWSWGHSVVSLNEHQRLT